VAGTAVQLRSGLQPIEKVERGDEILSWDQSSQSFVYNRVLQRFCAYRDDLITLEINGEEITCSANHRFLTADGQWIPAEELRAGDTLRGANFDKISLGHVARRNLAAPVAVYNFEIQSTHNYCVGIRNVIAHNLK
jgi:hypothetical protein